MKRLRFVCLALALALFSGCAQEIDENSSYVEGLITDPIESYDHASNIVPDGEESEVSAEQTTTDGFLVKDKKYTYKGQNIVMTYHLYYYDTEWFEDLLVSQNTSLSAACFCIAFLVGASLVGCAESYLRVKKREV